MERCLCWCCPWRRRPISPQEKPLLSPNHNSTQLNSYGEYPIDTRLHYNLTAREHDQENTYLTPCPDSPQTPVAMPTTPLGQPGSLVSCGSFHSCNSSLASMNYTAPRIRITPVLPSTSERRASQPPDRRGSVSGIPPTPVWLQTGREVVKVQVDDGDSKIFDFTFDGARFELHVDGHRVLQKHHLRLLRDMALDQEAAPHAPWKISYEDKKASIKAWTRPPPAQPWLAPADMQEGKCSINQVRVMALFDCPGSVLYDVLHDSEYRSTWDDRMLSGRQITQLTPRCDIGYYAANLPSPLSNRDFCNLRSWLELGKGEYVIANHSVRHHECPEGAYVRAVSLGTGYYITRRDDGRKGCVLYYVSHTDMKSSVPAWMLNGKLGAISSGVMVKLRVAAEKYPAWCKTHRPNGIAPWRTPESPWDAEEQQIAALVKAQEAAHQALLVEEVRAWANLIPAPRQAS